MTEHIVHPIPPLYDADSRVLILGSFPSVKSREAAFFYGHPQNRFWRVMARVLGCETPGSVPEKAAMLHAHHIALWDVIASCDISGSSDSSIQNAVPNDLSPILNAAKIQAVFCNGTTASRLYERYLLPVTGMQAVRLPSTSPANASFSLDRLTEQWQAVAAYLSGVSGRIFSPLRQISFRILPTPPLFAGAGYVMIKLSGGRCSARRHKQRKRMEHP